MGVNKELTTGEEVVLSTRTHAKAIFLPVLVLLVTVGCVGYLVARPPTGNETLWRVAALVVALLVILGLVLPPIMRWSSSTYTITNKRLMTRHGVFRRTGRDIPLFRINDVAYDKSFADRALGCGTLKVSDASENLPVELNDIPRVEKVHRTLTELLLAAGAPGSAYAGPATGQGPQAGEPQYPHEPYPPQPQQEGGFGGPPAR